MDSHTLSEPNRPMDEHQEKAIAEGLRRGQTEAWQALYDAYAWRVWGLIARSLSSNRLRDIPDVFQQTFLAAARSAHGYDPARGSLWFWLSGIARRHVAMYYRQLFGDDPMRWEGKRYVAAESRWVNNSGPRPEELAIDAEAARLVHVALGKISCDQESLLAAKYMEGASVEELAAAQRCSAVAIRSRLASARRDFRQALAEAVRDLKGPEPGEPS